jgi:hypothetical protein
MQRHRIIWLASGLTLLALIAVGMRTSSPASPVAQAQAPSDSHPEDIDELQAELSRLRSRLATLESQPRSPTPEGAPVEQKPAVTAEAEPEEEAEDRSIAREAFIGEIEQTFWQQGRDAEWSSTTETSLAEGLEGLDGITLLDLQCASALCRIEVDEQPSSPGLLQQLPTASPFDGDGFYHRLPDGRLVVYLARAGEALPRFQGGT